MTHKRQHTWLWLAAEGGSVGLSRPTGWVEKPHLPNSCRPPGRPNKTERGTLEALPLAVAAEKQRHENIMGASIHLTGNLVGLGAALATFAILAVSYVFFMKKDYMRSDYLVVFMIVNAVLFTFLMGFTIYTEDRSIRASGAS